MADDERRAEIEAIQRVLEDADLHLHMRMDSMPLKGDPAEETAEDILAALDHVRDARGDDEPDRLRRQRNDEFNAHSQTLLRLEAAEATRSPQGEDHETGDWLIRVCEHGYRVEFFSSTSAWHHMDAPVRDQGICHGDVESQEVVRVSRVSPSRDGTVAQQDWVNCSSCGKPIYEAARDGTVAVEDVERAALQALVDEARADDEWVSGPDLLLRVGAIVLDRLAAFSPASTGDRENDKRRP